MAAARRKPVMTAAHKAALAEGREQSRTIRAYLEGLEASRPRRGRRRTPESIQRRINDIDAGMDDASALARVQLIQERMDLAAELAKQGTGGPDMKKLEQGFARVAKAYSESKGISYGAWREAGVPAAVLRDAGIGR